VHEDDGFGLRAGGGEHFFLGGEGAVPTKSESASLRVARRYAETEAVRVLIAVSALAAVVVLAGLAWLRLIGT
jgi:hypothetical protein